MATSQTDDYTLTRDQVIRSAFERIGVAIANEPLDPNDAAVGAKHFNMLALSYKSYGLQLWKRGRDSVTLVASQASYALAPTLGAGTEKPQRILECVRKDSNGNEVSMTRLSLNEYENLPNKTQTGTPINYYFEPDRTGATLYVWPVPDSAAATEYTVEYVYQQPIQDHDVGNEDVDFPNEWYRALSLNLAYELADVYGLEINQKYLLRDKAQKALVLALAYDQEDTSIFIQPNTRRM